MGRTDQRGALWYALLVLGGYFLRELASIRLGESGFIDLIDQVFNGRHLGHALLHGLQAWAALTWALVSSFLIVLAMVRLGLIAAIMINFTASVMLLIPLSTEFPSDSSTQMILGLLTLVGLAVFGFFVSLGGQPLVRELSKNS